MKFVYTLLFFAALIYSTAASAQNSFWAEKKGPYGGSVGEIEYDAGKSMVYAIVDQRFFYSTDDGVTWSKSNLASNISIWDVEVGDNGSVYLTDGSAIYKSTNGKDFTKVTTDFTLSSGYKIRRISNGGGTIVALASNRLYFSTDDGVTFTAGASGSFNQSFLAVGTGISGGQGVYFLDNATSMPRRSVNGGVAVEIPTNTGLTGPCYNLASRNEKSHIYVVNGTGIFTSTDQGQNWSAIKGGTITDATIANGSNFGLLEFSSDNTGMYFIDNLNEKMHYKALTGTAWQQSVAYPGLTGFNIFSAMARTLNASSPATSVALFGNGFGLRKTTTGTSSFEPDVNTGIAMADAKSIMSVASGDGNLLIDTQNLGLMYSGDRGQSWSRVTTVPNGVQMMTGISNSTEKNHTVLALNNSLNDTYKTTTGSSFSLLATPVDFRWIQGTTFDRVFGLSAALPNQWYFSYNSGTTWSGAITIAGLPASYSINDLTKMNIYSLSSTTAVMFLELYNNGTPGTEYWRIIFTIGATTTISGSAAKITTMPVLYTSSLPDVMSARAGKFFMFTTTTTPDQYSFSTNSGTGWTTLNVPYTGNGRMFVADNGYVFFVSPTENKIWVTRDDGATFTEATLPPGTDLSLTNIADLHIDTEDFAQLICDKSNLHSSTNPIALPANPTTGGVLGRTATSIAIAWNDNANNEDNYRVERSSNGGTTYVYAGDAPSSTICAVPNPRGYFVDSGLNPSTAYLYKITAVNSAGTSIASASASTTTFAATTQNIPDGRSWNATTVGGGGYAAVTIPKVVGIRHLGGGKYEVSDIALGTFTSNYKETFYETNGQTTLAVTNSNLTVRNNGNGLWTVGTNTLTLRWKRCAGTETETVTYVLNGTPASDPAPLAPVGVQALVNATNSIEVSWAGAFYEKDYIVERSPNGTTGFVQIGSNVVAPTTKLIDPGPFTEATSYHYRVRSRNQNNVASPNSAVVVALYRKPTFLLSTAGGISTFNTVTLGMYAGDFNNDGKDDLYSVQANIISSATSQPVIFANQGGGNFNVVLPSMAAEGYMPAMLGDINNDGNLDVGMGISGKSQFDIYFGNGNFTFTKATVAQLGDIASVDFTVSSASLTDFNKDGRLDILLMESGDEDFLYEQTVGGSFVKVTGGDLALDANSHNGGLWADYDNDGDPDLLFVHSSTKWRLYRNNGDKTFTNVTVAAGLQDCEGMGGPWGDYNNDGHLDLFAGDSGENALYKNNGNGTFTKEGATGVSQADDTYGNIWGDFNNDGTIDLATPTLPFLSGPTRLFINNTTGAASFQLIESEKINDGLLAHYGGAAFDYDDNGFLDLGLANFSLAGGQAAAGAQTLYVNNNSTGNWLETKLVGVASNKSAIGARVIVVAGGKTYIREVAAVNSFFSQSSFVQHFGIGSATSITSVQVKWPSGVVQNLPGPTINQKITITEDGGGPVPTTYLPANDATGINTRTSLEVTFNETPTPVNGKMLTITATGDVSPTYSIDMSTATVNGMKLTFALPGRLLSNKHYDVAIEQAAVLDAFSNPSLAVTSGWGFTTAAGPTISTLSPLDEATAVLANAPLEITWSTTVTAVADKKIKVMTGPTTLLDVAVSATGVAGAKYTVSAPSGGWPYLSPITVTLDGGAFIDGSSNDTDAIVGGTWNFTTIESPDVIPPSIGDISGLPATTDKTALAQTFNISVTDNKGVANAKVFYRQSSGGTGGVYTENAATAPTTGDVWQFQIPASGFDATGVQYYFTATDIFGNVTRAPATGTRQTLIKYKGTEAQIPTSLLGTGGTKTGWKVIAIPFDLGVSNAVLSVFDELASLEKKVAWRLLALQPEPTAWLDYPEQLSTLSRGVGYFINIVSPPTIIVGDNLVAPGNTRDNLFKMDLKKGWNMVGNPYLEGIDWANVVAANGITGTAVVFKKYSGGSYTNSTTLVPYEGGFVQSETDKQVSIPFLGQVTSAGRTAEVEFGPDEWLVPIVVQQGEISNNFGGVGMHSKALSSFDLFDDFNGPRWIGFTEMNFKHPEHFVKNFARDVVPLANEYVWEFTVESNLPDIGILKWDVESHPAEKDLYLFDVATQTPVNMKESSSYSFDPKTSQRFKIYYGENALSKISPDRVTLGAAYPNPMAGVTTIPFSIPEKGGRMSVRLEVFDATGRKVSTLANGPFTAGFYKGEWQPQEALTDGLYFYRLLAGEEVLTGKVVLKK